MCTPRVRLDGLPAFCLMFFFASCAKTGDPQPPLLLVPRPSADLAARQISDKILLNVSMPSENTDGSPVTTLAEVEILRVVEDRSRTPSPRSEEEFLRQAQTVLLVSTDKLPAYLEGNTLVFRDEPGGSLVFSGAFRYGVRFINKQRQTAGLGNQAYLAPVPIPGPPATLSFQLGQEYVRIRWRPPTENMDGSRPARISSYNIYRTEDLRKFPPAPLNKEPIQATEFEDREFQFDKTYYYAASVVGNRENPYAESLPSPPLLVPTRDTFPPSVPENPQAVFEGGKVFLFWTAPPERDVVGYKIYRKEVGQTESQLLNSELEKIPSFRDEKPIAGKKYEYLVTAVDIFGNEGPPATAPVEIP